MMEYYFVQAGRGGKHFPEFRRKDYVAVDYYEDCDFDLKGMKKDEIEAKTGGRFGTELLNISQIKKSDMIAVVEGNKNVKEFAIAISDYYFVQSNTAVTKERNKHRVDVEYLDFGTTDFGKGKVPAIVKDKGKMRNYFSKKQINSGNESNSDMSKSGASVYSETLKNDLNLLFYGPPGTGKTYLATELAEESVSGNVLSDRDFENVYAERLIQPYSVKKLKDDKYEQFVRYEIEKEAKKQGYTFALIKSGQKKKQNTKRITLEKNGKEIHVILNYSKSIKKGEKSEQWLQVSDDQIKFLDEADPSNRYIICLNNATRNFVVLPYSIEQDKANFGRQTQKNWDGTGKKKHQFHIQIEQDKVELPQGKKGKSYNCSKFARNIKMMFGQYIKKVTFHPSYSYEEFVEGIRPNLDSDQISYKLEDGIFKEMCRSAERDPDNFYVLLIDEINRGNIPKIFGELITLIEDEKRGKYSLNLTYSKDSFSVPKNLYIIGTMNTADQSISHLDIALRRRFSHKELMPDSKLLQVEDANGKLVSITITHGKKTIDLVNVLTKINNSVRIDAGREKQIGHAYFMKDEKPISEIKMLRDRFENKIIPLIQDYFYENMVAVSKILGDSFIDAKKEAVKKENLSDLDKFADAVNNIPTRNA